MTHKPYQYVDTEDLVHAVVGNHEHASRPWVIVACATSSLFFTAELPGVSVVQDRPVTCLGCIAAKG